MIPHFSFFNAMKVRLRLQLGNLIWIIMSEKTLSEKKKVINFTKTWPNGALYKKKIKYGKYIHSQPTKQRRNNKEKNIWPMTLREDI